MQHFAAPKIFRMSDKGFGVVGDDWIADVSEDWTVEDDVGAVFIGSIAKAKGSLC